MHPFFSPNPVVLAHRGDSKRFPENTMPAFRSALQMKVDVIETDVHITKDGVVVIWHDDDLSRLCGEAIPVYEKTYAELLTHDAGCFYIDENGNKPFEGKGITIARFDELLELDANQRINVDMKDPKPELVRAMADLLRKYNAVGRVCVASFHSQNIFLLRKIMPDALTSFTSKEVAKYVLTINFGLGFLWKRFPSCVFQMPERMPETKHGIRLLTKRFIKYCHKRNIKIQIWTINEADEMRRLLAMGVDGLFTDDPALMLEVLKRPVQNS